MFHHKPSLVDSIIVRIRDAFSKSASLSEVSGPIQCDAGSLAFWILSQVDGADIKPDQITLAFGDLTLVVSHNAGLPSGSFRLYSWLPQCLEIDIKTLSPVKFPNIRFVESPSGRTMAVYKNYYERPGMFLTFSELEGHRAYSADDIMVSNPDSFFRPASFFRIAKLVQFMKLVGQDCLVRVYDKKIWSPEDVIRAATRDSTEVFARTITDHELSGVGVNLGGPSDDDPTVISTSFSTPLDYLKH